MSYSIYLIQSTYHQTPAHLDQLAQLAQINDVIILMADAVLWANDPRLQTFKQVYVLTSEALLLSVHPANVQVIDYPQLADLILQTTTCIRLH